MSCRRIRVTNVALVPGTSLTLVVPAQNFSDYCNYEICANVDLTTATGTEEIVINDGTTNYPLQDCLAGNTWTVNELQCFADCCGCRFTRLLFRMTYGSTGALAANEPHFLVKYPTPNFCGRFAPTGA